MRPHSFRFRPPAGEVPPAARWALHRAFATAEGAAGTPDVAEAIHWAGMLGLGARIAHRWPEETLAGDLDPGAARRLTDLRYRAAAQGLQMQELASVVAGVAAAAGIPLILLKGVALMIGGWTSLGSRRVGDLDVLTPRKSARRLSEALRAAGFRPSIGIESKHHLRGLAHPTLGLVEIHLFLHGVRRGAGELDAAELIAAGLCRALPQPAGALLPAAEILAAHAVSHGLHQHGRAPLAYPFLQFAGDLLDLARGRPGELERLLDAARPLLTGSVSSRELDAVARLCGGLATGDPGAYEGDSGRLLVHATAGIRNAGYRRRLRLRSLVEVLRRGDLKKIFGRLAGLLWFRRGRMKYPDAKLGTADSPGERTSRDEP